VSSATSDRRGLLAICLTAVLWATIGIAVRLLQDHAHLSSLSILFWRLAFGSAVLVVVVRAGGARSLLAELRRPVRLLLVSAGSIGFQLSYFYAVADDGVAVPTLITLGLAPVAALGWESWRAGRRPPSRTVAVLVCALTGLALVSTSQASHAIAPHPLRGVLLSILSGMLYAASTLLSRGLSGRLSPQALTAGSTLIGVLLLLGPTAASGISIPFTLPVIAGLAYLGVVTTALAYALFYFGLRTTSGGVAMVATLLEPATAVVLAAVVLSEPITLASGTGALLVLTAVAVLYLGPAGQGVASSHP
jgi:DME family drug/metabolite transporter